MSVPRYPSAATDPSPLGQKLPFVFSGRTAKNRLLKAATTERLASWIPTDFSASGVVTDELVNLYRRWGEGGYGVIISGNIMVCADHLEACGNIIIPSDASDSKEDERFSKLKELASAAKTHGSLMIGQLSHPGRQTRVEFQKNPVSASDVALTDTLGMSFGKPHAATELEIGQITDAFVHAAVILEKAGWDGIQIHAAHGYLLAQFLSPTTNLRTDQYGGTFENRVRLILEIILAIRRRVAPSFIISLKVNSVEFQHGAFTTSEAAQMCKLLEQEAHVDFVEMSGGTYEELAFDNKRASTIKREAFFLEFAEQISPALQETKVYVTGGFKTVAGMVGALRSMDGVGVARPACQEFDFGNKVLEGRINGAVLQKVDDQDFMLTNVIAGTQMRQVSQGLDPMDLSKQENVERFLRDMGEWVARLQQDAGLRMSGFVEHVSIEAQPYGTRVW